MRSISTEQSFPLASVKPLDGIRAYRRHCVAATRQAVGRKAVPRRTSPVTGARLQPWGDCDGLPFGRCPDGGGVFLMEVAPPEAWAVLLASIAAHRRSPEAFHSDLLQSRTDHVYTPKIEWIRETLRFQGLERPRILEVTTPPSACAPLLEESGCCASVEVVDEMRLAHPDVTPAARPPERAEAAVLFESLDRVDDPAALLRAACARVAPGGLVFVTALVSSGFDMLMLGARNLYLCPPDRTNSFTLAGLSALLQSAGLTLVEVSTPGVLDVEIVRAHRRLGPSLPCSAFERSVLEADADTQAAFQLFLQQRGLSSFARIVGRTPE